MVASNILYVTSSRGSQRLAPLRSSSAESNNLTVDVYLAGLERALGRLVVGYDDTLQDLRHAIYAQISIHKLPPRFAFAKDDGGGIRHEASERVADYAPRVVIAPKTVRGALPTSGRIKAMRKAKAAVAAVLEEDDDDENTASLVSRMNPPLRTAWEPVPSIRPRRKAASPSRRRPSPKAHAAAASTATPFVVANLNRLDSSMSAAALAQLRAILDAHATRAAACIQRVHRGRAGRRLAAQLKMDLVQQKRRESLAKAREATRRTITFRRLGRAMRAGGPKDKPTRSRSRRPSLDTSVVRETEDDESSTAARACCLQEEDQSNEELTTLSSMPSMRSFGTTRSSFDSDVVQFSTGRPTIDDDAAAAVKDSLDWWADKLSHDEEEGPHLHDTAACRRLSAAPPVPLPVSADLDDDSGGGKKTPRVGERASVLRAARTTAATDDEGPPIVAYTSLKMKSVRHLARIRAVDSNHFSVEVFLKAAKAWVHRVTVRCDETTDEWVHGVHALATQHKEIDDKVKVAFCKRVACAVHDVDPVEDGPIHELLLAPPLQRRVSAIPHAEVVRRAGKRLLVRGIVISGFKTLCMIFRSSNPSACFEVQVLLMDHNSKLLTAELPKHELDRIAAGYALPREADDKDLAEIVLRTLQIRTNDDDDDDDAGNHELVVSVPFLNSGLLCEVLDEPPLPTPLLAAFAAAADEPVKKKQPRRSKVRVLTIQGRRYLARFLVLPEDGADSSFQVHYHDPSTDGVTNLWLRPENVGDSISDGDVNQLIAEAFNPLVATTTTTSRKTSVVTIPAQRETKTRENQQEQQPEQEVADATKKTADAMVDDARVFHNLCSLPQHQAPCEPYRDQQPLQESRPLYSSAVVLCGKRCLAKVFEDGDKLRVKVYCKSKNVPDLFVTMKESKQRLGFGTPVELTSEVWTNELCCRLLKLLRLGNPPDEKLYLESDQQLLSNRRRASDQVPRVLGEATNRRRSSETHATTREYARGIVVSGQRALAKIVLNDDRSCDVEILVVTSSTKLKLKIPPSDMATIVNPNQSDLKAVFKQVSLALVLVDEKADGRRLGFEKKYCSENPSSEVAKDEMQRDGRKLFSPTDGGGSAPQMASAYEKSEEPNDADTASAKQQQQQQQLKLKFDRGARSNRRVGLKISGSYAVCALDFADDGCRVQAVKLSAPEVKLTTHIRADILQPAADEHLICSRLSIRQAGGSEDLVFEDQRQKQDEHDSLMELPAIDSIDVSPTTAEMVDDGATHIDIVETPAIATPATTCSTEVASTIETPPAAETDVSQHPVSIMPNPTEDIIASGASSLSALNDAASDVNEETATALLDGCDENSRKTEDVSHQDMPPKSTNIKSPRCEKVIPAFAGGVAAKESNGLNEQTVRDDNQASEPIGQKIATSSEEALIAADGFDSAPERGTLVESESSTWSLSTVAPEEITRVAAPAAVISSVLLEQSPRLSDSSSSEGSIIRGRDIKVGNQHHLAKVRATDEGIVIKLHAITSDEVQELELTETDISRLGLVLKNRFDPEEIREVSETLLGSLCKLQTPRQSSLGFALSSLAPSPAAFDDDCSDVTVKTAKRLDGEFSLLLLKFQTERLRVEAHVVNSDTQYDLELGPSDWRHLGFGPVDTMSNENKLDLCNVVVADVDLASESAGGRRLVLRRDHDAAPHDSIQMTFRLKSNDGAHSCTYLLVRLFENGDKVRILVLDATRDVAWTHTIDPGDIHLPAPALTSQVARYLVDTCCADGGHLPKPLTQAQGAAEHNRATLR